MSNLPEETERKEVFREDSIEVEVEIAYAQNILLNSIKKDEDKKLRR